MSDPYRPLYVVDEPAPDDPSRVLRGLAVLLVVLGALRVTPAVAHDESSAEALLGWGMLVAGAGGLLGGQRRVRALVRRLRGLLTRP